MTKEKMDAILEKRNIQVTSLNRELLLFSEFKLTADWSEDEEKKAKKALNVATHKVTRSSCTTDAEEQFYVGVIERLADRMKDNATV